MHGECSRNINTGRPIINSKTGEYFGKRALGMILEKWLSPKQIEVRGKFVRGSIMFRDIEVTDRNSM